MGKGGWSRSRASWHCYGRRRIEQRNREKRKFDIAAEQVGTRNKQAATCKLDKGAPERETKRGKKGAVQQSNFDFFVFFLIFFILCFFWIFLSELG